MSDLERFGFTKSGITVKIADIFNIMKNLKATIGKNSTNKIYFLKTFNERTNNIHNNRIYKDASNGRCYSFSCTIPTIREK